VQPSRLHTKVFAQSVTYLHAFQSSNFFGDEISIYHATHHRAPV
jgi:hypothetical protein